MSFADNFLRGMSQARAEQEAERSRTEREDERKFQRDYLDWQKKRLQLQDQLERQMTGRRMALEDIQLQAQLDPHAELRQTLAGQKARLQPMPSTTGVESYTPEMETPMRVPGLESLQATLPGVEGVAPEREITMPYAGVTAQRATAAALRQAEEKARMEAQYRPISPGQYVPGLKMGVSPTLPGPVPGRDVPYPSDVEAQRIRMERAKQGIGAGQELEEGEAPTDPTSQSILAQTGLSYAAFLALTGQASKLPRDRVSRQRAFNEAQTWANKKGVDVATLASQYQSYNDVLASNIDRLNRTLIMEDELQGTIENLEGVVKDKDLTRLRFANVIRIWAGQEVNDNLAQQYAMHLYQLRNELAAYGAATQGRSGNQITIADQREAETAIKSGISSGSLAGLKEAVENSTEKMGQVMQRSVNTARKAVWELFGVGERYRVGAPSGEPDVIEYEKGPDGIPRPKVRK